MFKNQLEVIEKTAQYLDSKKEIGIEAFKQLAAKCREIQPQFVLLMMPHENLEVYWKIGEEWKPCNDFEGILSQDEMEEMQRYDYSEENVHEDYMYWETTTLAGYIFEMWLSHCFHASKVGEELDISFYYMSVPESEEVFHLNSCRKKMRKSAFQEYYKMTMENNVVDLGL